MSHEELIVGQEVFAALLVIFFTALVGRTVRMSYVSALVFGGALLSLFTLIGFGPFPKSPQLLIGLAGGGLLVLLLCHGLSSSLDKLKKSWKIIVVGGGVQLGLTIILGFSAAWLIVPDCTVSKALFVGILMSTASSAVVYSDLKSRDKEHTPEAYFSNNCLTTHDLSLAPFAVLVPAIATHGHGAFEVVGHISLGVAITAAVFVLEWFLISRVLDWAGRHLEREMFYLTVALFVAGTVYVCMLAELAPSFGMFLGGILIARTRYKDFVRGLVVPLRNLALPFFFVSVGFLFRWEVLTDHWFRILLSAIGLLLIKFIAVTASALLVGLTLRPAMRAGGLLAHLGESSFVLGVAGLKLGLITQQDAHIFIVLSVFTVWGSPYLNRWLDRLVEKVPDKGLRHLGVDTLWNKEIEKHENHIVLVGFGRVGSAMAGWLKDEMNTPHVIIDSDADRCDLAVKNGHEVVNGDASHSHILKRASAYFARAIVITDGSTELLSCLVGALKFWEKPPQIIVRTNQTTVAAQMAEDFPDVIVICDEVFVVSPLQAKLHEFLSKREKEAELAVTS